MNVTSIWGGLSIFLTSDLRVKQRHHSANGTQLACCCTLPPATSEILLAKKPLASLSHSSKQNKNNVGAVKHEYYLSGSLLSD